jgi:hypothetical protein
MRITAFRLERRESGNVVVLRDDNGDTVAIEQSLFQQILETLFPESALKTVSRWDVGTWHDLTWVTDGERGLTESWNPVVR